MFLDDNYKTAKIIDFGLSCNIKVNEKKKNLLGTPLYLAPEVISKFRLFMVNMTNVVIPGHLV